MKKFLLLLFAVASLQLLHEQKRKYRLFKTDLTAGLAFPIGNTYLDQRLALSIEPKYNISDRSSVGLRLEVAPSINFAGTTEPWTIGNVLSFLITGDRYFKVRESRPFVGVGAGVFDQHLSDAAILE